MRVVESLGHKIQKCPRMDGAKYERRKVSDDYNLNRVHDNKVLKYDTQNIHTWMLRSAPVDWNEMPNVGSFICNWRGVMSHAVFQGQAL